MELWHLVCSVYNQVVQLHTKQLNDQRTIDRNRNGNSATFFSYGCNATTFLKSCFILFKITASISFVSLTFVVLNIRQPNWLRRTQTKKANGKRTNSHAFSQSKTQKLNFYRSFHYTRGNGVYYLFH